MIQTRRIGNARITRVQEYSGPTHDPKFLLPGVDVKLFNENADWLNPNHWVASMDKLVVTLQSWLVHYEDNVILIDTGVGNHKDRTPVERMHRLNTLYLPWLEAAGAPVDTVTHVIMTHLHTDHVGWNTVYMQDKWVPTFPNAVYMASTECLAHARAMYETGKNTVQNRAFSDSVEPLLEENRLVEFVPGDTLASCLVAEEASGHMPGQVTLRLQSNGMEAMFVGDVLHNAIQIVKPQLNSCYDSHPEIARETRHRVLSLAAERNALLLPAHFGEPYCGYIRKSGESFKFEPSTW